MPLFHRHRPSVILFCSILAVIACPLYAKKKPPVAQSAQADSINVVAHLNPSAGLVTRFLVTQHAGRFYLYAEHASSKTMTLIDVTDPGRPAILAELNFPADQPSDQLLAVMGNAALVTSRSEPELAPAALQIVRIFSFADPLRPQVKQEFQNVTNVTADTRRGLFYLANSDGIWILRERLVPDPAVEKQFEQMLNAR